MYKANSTLRNTTPQQQETTIMTTTPTEKECIAMWEESTSPQDYEEKYDSRTTEERLTDVRATMRDYRPAETFGRQHGRINGYYYTEPVDIGRV